jgi:hypothetical protein
MCAVLAVAGSMMLDATVVRAQSLGYTGSVFVSNASYPGDGGRATSVYVFNSVDVATGPVRASVSVPFVRRNATFTDPTVDPVSGGATEWTETAIGLGDPLVRADFTLFNDRSRGLLFTIAGSVKFPLASVEDGLGTGETDVGVGGTFFGARGSTSLFADLMFWSYGDPPGWDYPDSLSYSVGVGRVLGSGRWSTMASLGGFSHALEGQPGPLQLTVTMLALVGRRQSIAFTAGVGLNDASRGLSAGTTWRIVR